MSDSSLPPAQSTDQETILDVLRDIRSELKKQRKVLNRIYLTMPSDERDDSAIYVAADQICEAISNLESEE